MGLQASWCAEHDMMSRFIELMQILLQGDIVPGLAAKQPKVVAGCTLALKEIVRYVFYCLVRAFTLLKMLYASCLSLLNPTVSCISRFNTIRSQMFWYFGGTSSSHPQDFAQDFLS